MKTKISVTKSDIVKGVPHLTTGCPVYLALKRYKFPVKNVWCFCLINTRFIKIKLPVRVTKFIKDFDRGKPVKPFNFWVER